MSIKAVSNRLGSAQIYRVNRAVVFLSKEGGAKLTQVARFVTTHRGELLPSLRAKCPVTT